MEDTCLISPRIRDLFSLKNLNSILSEQQENTLICKCCNSILYNPTFCKSCENVFCGMCYEKFSKEAGSCPNMCGGSSNSSSYSLYNEELINLKFSCNNKMNGCTKIVSYKDILKHNKECAFQFIKCSASDKCASVILRSHKNLHEKHCPYVSVECEFCTEFPIRKINLIKHLKEECKSAESCTECLVFFKKNEKNKHKCIISLQSQIEVLNDRFISQQKDYESINLIRRIEIHKLNHDNNEILKRLANIEHIFRVIPKIIDGESTLDIFEHKHHCHQKEDSDQEFHSAVNNELVENILTESKEEHKQEIINKSKEENKNNELQTNIPVDTTTTKNIVEESKEEFDEGASFKIPIMRAPYEESIIMQKVNLFKKMLDENNWVLSSSSGNIPVYSYEGEGNITGLSGNVECPAPFESMMHLCSNEDTMKGFNPMLDKLIVLEEIDANTQIALLSFHGMLIVSGREFLVMIRRHTFEDGSQGLISFSIDEYANSPEVGKGKVRADMVIGGWHFKPISEDKTIVTNLAINDLKGSIPKFVANAAVLAHNYTAKQVENKTLMLPHEFIEIHKNRPGFMEAYEHAKTLLKKTWEIENNKSKETNKD